MVSIFVNIPQNDTLITFAPSSSSSSSRLWRRVRRELEKPYSKLRQYDAQYLTYALLDQSVDLLVPVVKVMRREISDEHQYLRSTEYTHGLRRIHTIRMNLEKVNRTIKPYIRVLVHSIEDDAICPGVTFYLRDVLDNLENIDDELRQLIDQCQAIDSDADKYHDQQMNRTLYILTVVSAIFLPAQFLTGVWGMNFSSMEELNKPWGYEMFWIIVSVMTVFLLGMFCVYGRLRTVED
jgi:Mg2+ and Co2+ transporter CorA